MPSNERSEVQALRDEVTALRVEMMALRAEVLYLSQFKQTPQYTTPQFQRPAFYPHYQSPGIPFGIGEIICKS